MSDIMKIFSWIKSFLGIDSMKLTREEVKDLKDIERRAYIEKAKELVEKRGQDKAVDKYEY